jgi:serine/threonine-protein kinase
VSDLQGPLQRALGDAHRLERELGGGGMSRVFVATETALGRQVVIKLLSPSLAEGVSADRFRREIQLAARLQHPHIVPLLAAGEVTLDAGASRPLLYFTMPYVEGESLRARLKRGALPAVEVQRILREVADALAYAHAQGIVHRDIKPDNILLSGNHAVVTDFGVAKALSTATTGGDVAVTSATMIGTVIGTPAYMAPEQAAGDPDVGPAADLYALGATTFEMLAGRTPFTGTTPQAILAAQLTMEPPAVESVAGDLPAMLPPVVRRLLSREPGDRPTALELIGLLESASTPAPGTLVATAARRPGRAWRAAGVVAAVAAVAVVALRMLGVLPARSLMAEGRFGDRDQVVLANVEVPGDSSLGGALTEALRIDMGQSRILSVMPVSQVRSTLELMRQSPDRALDATVAREVAMRSGAKAALVGRVERVGGQYAVALRLVNPETGDDLAAFRATAADSTQLLTALDGVSKQMRRRIGESLRMVRESPALERVSTSSLAALQEYSEGTRLAEASLSGEALPHLQEAVRLDTTFAMAWRKLGIVQSNLGRRTAAVEALTRAYGLRDRLPELEKRVTTASYFGSVARDPARAVPAYEAVLELDSINVPALNNLAVILQGSGRPAESVRYAERLIAAERAGPRVNTYQLLAVGLSQVGLLDSAVAVLDGAMRLFPDNQELRLAAGRGLYLTSGVARAESVATAIADGKAVPPGTRIEAHEAAVLLLLVQGRLDDVEPRVASMLKLLASAGVEGAEEGIALARASYSALVFGTTASAQTVDSVRRAMEKLPPVTRPYGELAFAYVLAERPADARDVLQELDAQDDAVARDPGFRAAVEAFIALAEGRKEEARTIANAMNSDSLQSCIPCSLVDRFRLYVATGAEDSAVATGERYLTYTGPDRLDEDVMALAFIRQRLGELYQARGNTARAAALYQAVLDQWRRADPEFAPLVADTKRRLAEVSAEPAS